MNFGALPPEVNSGRMYLGPGPATLLAASAAWESLAAELAAAASGYQSVIASLTDESWLGPTSMSMAAAVMPYVSWMMATAEQCEQAGTQATAAAAAFETAYAMTVPPPLIAANRAQLMALIATNILGQNTPAIMATEAEYSEMWAQDATAMYAYAASSASASTFSAFTAPPQTTNPGGEAGQIGGQAGALAQAATGTVASLGSSGASAPIGALSSLTGASAKSATKGASAGVGAASGLASVLGGASGMGDAAGLASDVAGLSADGAGLGADGGGIGIDLYGLSLDFEGAGSILGAEGAVGLPGIEGLGGLGGGASASVGQAASLGTLSVPPGWADAASSVTPLPAPGGNVTPAGSSAAPGAGISRLPLGGMVGRESEGVVQRIGFRSTLIPRSPVAG